MQPCWIRLLRRLLRHPSVGTAFSSRCDVAGRRAEGPRFKAKSLAWQGDEGSSWPWPPPWPWPDILDALDAPSTGEHPAIQRGPAKLVSQGTVAAGNPLSQRSATVTTTVTTAFFTCGVTVR